MTIEDQIDEHHGETVVSRSMRLLILLAPLTLAVIVPSIVYGVYSSRAANDAFAFVEGSLISDTDGTTVDQASFCSEVGSDVSELSFYELAENADEASSSLSNLGFSVAAIDFKGWLDEPPVSQEQDKSDSSSTGQDLRDDITFSVVRAESSSDSADESSWCIDDIEVR